MRCFEGFFYQCDHATTDVHPYRGQLRCDDCCMRLAQVPHAAGAAGEAELDVQSHQPLGLAIRVCNSNKGAEC